MFDMKANGIKVGDKLFTYNGVVCEVVHIDHALIYPYELRSCMNPDNRWTVDRFGYLICDELNPDEDIAGFADTQQTETASENKVGFDMTKTKVGDKLLTRGGEEVVFMENDQHGQYPFVIQTADGWTYSVNMDGNLWTVGENPMDIVGFADEQSRTSEVVSEPENKGVKSDQREHSHYFKDVRHLDFIDVYRVIDLWELKDPALQHALKKLLVPGNRGHKDIQKDVQDVIDSCKRWQEMQAENNVK